MRIMANQTIPFIGEAYAVASDVISGQECTNLFIEVAKDGKTPAALYGTPGLDLLITIGSGPIRAEHKMGGLLYVLSGNTLYEITNEFVATSKGTVESSDDGDIATTMDDNGIQLCICVPVEGNAYIYTVSSGLAIISDNDWVAADSVFFIDTYFIFSRSNSARWHISGSNDGTTYNALEFATAESKSDLLKRVFVLQDRIWLFGDESIEQWQNTANADFPFEKIIGGTLERGCGAMGSVAQLDNTVYWLGDDNNIYRAGEAPERISTHAVEFAISGYEVVVDARGYTYVQGGHTFYILTFPTEDVTWGYDVSTQMWHKRSSDGTGRHLGNTYSYFNRNHVIGDSVNGNLYKFNLDTYTDNGSIIKRTRITKPLFKENRRVFMSRLQIDFESGVGLNLGQGSDPKVMLSWSDDGGKTFGNEHWRSIGKIGQYGFRAIWRKLGQFYQRTFKLEITDPIKVVITSAQADVTIGE